MIEKTKIIDGKAFAVKLRNRIAQEVAKLAGHNKYKPGLAVILVGDDPASHVYVRNKEKKTFESGMESFKYKLPKETCQEGLLDLIKNLNQDDRVDGILCQLPLPKHLNSELVINSISPDKDVDGFHISNVGNLATGQPSMIPCTPLGSLLLLRNHFGSLSGLHATVLGRSNIVGKPMANLLLKDSCTVTIAHSRTRNLREISRQADILVAAVGRPEMIKSDWIKPGGVVIDVGINRIPAPEKGIDEYRIVGDVAFSEAVNVASAITPVPGGVGPMTIACLLSNTLVAYCRRRGLREPAGLSV